MDAREIVRTDFSNHEVDYLDKQDVAAISITAGGGMGSPGQVVLYYRSRNKVVIAKGNHAYGNLNLNLLNKKLQCFYEENNGWKEFYMGAGNSLYVNASAYPELSEKFVGRYDDEIWMMHQEAIVKALSGKQSHSGDKRQKNRAIAAETMRIINDGHYDVDGERIEFDFANAWLEEVELLEPGHVEDLVDNEDGYLDDPTHEYPECEYLVVNMDSFEANYRYALSDRALVMNFASAHYPGGGFLNGAAAQEESLCRNSTLFASIGSKKAKAMYDYNEEDNDPFYSDYMLLSPYVTVFRNAAGELVADKFNTAVITVPAINLKRLPKGAERTRIPAIMENRIEGMLCAALREDYNVLILGAWGCGAFGHDANDVAGYFKNIIVNKEYYKYFKKIVFAVLDTSKQRYNYRSFCKVFGDRGVWENPERTE